MINLLSLALAAAQRISTFAAHVVRCLERARTRRIIATISPSRSIEILG